MLWVTLFQLQQRETFSSHKPDSLKTGTFKLCECVFSKTTERMTSAAESVVWSDDAVIRNGGEGHTNETN